MIRVVFTAKVALSAGYFIYGDSFVKNADYESLRKLMNCKKGDSLEPLGELPLAVACSLSATEDLDENKIISRAFPISTIQFKLYPDNRIRTTVAIGGKFLGSVTYQAEISRLPNSGEFEGGRLF